MDFFPDLGEPGLLDELFYLGPIVLQAILGWFFFWLLGLKMKSAGLGARIAAAAGLLVGANILLFIAIVVIFKLANPSLS
jgi:hypothetical protein